ncbi:hypothetical protein BH18ACI2_BH18ACI2_09380 [soil metagenome]
MSSIKDVARQKPEVRKVTFLGLPNCCLLTDGTAEVVVTTDVGPRVVSYGFVGGENVLGECAGEKIETERGVWRPYGGHRPWTAPEALPRSYAPDNDAVAFKAEGEFAIRLTPPAEKQTGVQKEITVALDGAGGVRLRHRITNLNSWRVELAAWALTIMRGGGVAIIPQEPYGPHPQYLLPSRPLVLWPYTDMSDARLSFGRKLILVRTDERAASPQKIGVANKRGWAAYLIGETLFVKHSVTKRARVTPTQDATTRSSPPALSSSWNRCRLSQSLSRKRPSSMSSAGNCSRA